MVTGGGDKSELSPVSAWKYNGADIPWGNGLATPTLTRLCGTNYLLVVRACDEKNYITCQIKSDFVNYWNYHNEKIVDPGRATIYIVPVFTLQEVRRITLTAQQHTRRPYTHGSGGDGNVPSCPFFPRGVTASYRPTIIRASCINILLFIQFIFDILWYFLIIRSYLW